jgi:hypothetical protein
MSYVQLASCDAPLPTSFTAILSNKVLSAATGFYRPFSCKLNEPELNLSGRTYNGLMNDNIVYVGDLVQKTEGELLRTSNFGRKSLNEIKEVLTKMGLYLGMKVPGWPPETMESFAKARVAFLGTEIDAICQSLSDPWPSNVVALASTKNPIIDDDDEKVRLPKKSGNALATRDRNDRTTETCG